MDITERERTGDGLRTGQEDLEDFFENGVVALHLVGPDGIILRANRAELELLGYAREEYLGRHIAEFHTDPDTIGDILARLSRGERLDKYPARLRAKTGSIRHVLISSSVQFRDGRFVNTRCFTLDVTGLRAAEERQRALVAELSHRVKNVLAVVQAIAGRTVDGTGTTAAFVAAFRGRLGALAAAHDLLAEGGWRGAGLAELARRTLAPHAGRGGDRLGLGVEDVALPPALAQTLGLTLHELATNAAKYGALSAPEGRVRLTGGEAVDDRGGRELRLAWREEGGPPVGRPAARGFGTTLLERALAHQHGGRVELDWQKKGLSCTIRIPLAEAGHVSAHQHGPSPDGHDPAQARRADPGQ
jgi:two-component system, chemotaxis family, CheB/CheR fusion protein